jgi:hypothetical protein
VTRLTPARDLDPTRWIVEALQTFGESVLSLVPSGFETYVRVFHPAWRLDEEGMPTAPVRWADVARTKGTQAGPGMQFRALLSAATFEWNLEREPNLFDTGPHQGSLSESDIRALVRVLAHHTTRPDRCWFAFWDGWGGLREDLALGPIFHLPARGYHLLSGPLSAADESAVGWPARQSASLWWPDDRSWLVATEIDLDSTYIGCRGACRDGMVSSSDLEALEIDPATGIDWSSDPVNPSPLLARARGRRRT